MIGIRRVGEYLSRYRDRLLLTGIMVFLLHGSKLNSGIIGIDTEALIRLQDGFYGGWLQAGREGGIPAAKGAWLYCGILWISHPVMVEQFYFSLQSMEICIALLLTALSLYLSYQWTDRSRIDFAAAGMVLLLIPFSSYHAFIIIYIFGTVTLLLLQAIGEILKRKPAGAKLRLPAESDVLGKCI